MPWPPDLSQANLSGAKFTADGYFGVADLSGANLSGANLTNAYFAGFIYRGDLDCGYAPGANLTGANLTGADARGADFYLATLDGANTSNLIQSNGHNAGLDLAYGAPLVIRDYVGNPVVSEIVVEQHMAMDTTGTLRLEFDTDAWDSTISFAPGITVALGGTLELDFASVVDVAMQVGRTIDLFDWTGVMPTGAFHVESPYTWNLSQLYSTGEVTLLSATAMPGDFNHNSIVDGIDFLMWQRGESPGGPYSTSDLADWEDNFGFTVAPLSSPTVAVPEPAGLVVLLSGFLAMLSRRHLAERKTDLIATK